MHTLNSYPQEVGVHASRLCKFLEELDVPGAAAKAFPSLGLVRGVHYAPSHTHDSPSAQGVTVKLQCNEGQGGCFPLHYDNAGPPSNRKLTCLFYLTSDWHEAHGGELQLVPWLRQPVTIPPLSGRIHLGSNQCASAHPCLTVLA